MKILESIWFTNASGCLGIVRVEDQWEGIKYYIAAVGGLNAEQDEKFIASYGSTFPKDAGDVLFERSYP
jgi:hypothetical protein